MTSDQNNNMINKIGLWISNLMDRVRVGDSLKKQGFQIENIPDLSACHKFLEADSNNIVVIDLMASSVKLEMFHEQFNDFPEVTKRIVGYFPHVQIQLKKDAQQCGIKHVFPRSMFFADSARLIRRVVDGG